ncbi:hypothetical protein [Streptomyces sp. NPDC091268]|uniref:hypothetical protein n=1 Tax=Streptomyces sp. NPDC091268 TaxID=3365979 RepID=UPI003815D329
MNDPIRPAATDYEQARGLPETTAFRPPAEGGPPPAEGAPEAAPHRVSGAAPDRGPDPAVPEAGADPVPDPAPDSLPDPAGAGARPQRTLLVTAATGRPLEEVAALVSLLKESGQLPNPGHEALRAAAVSRPLHEVGEMLALLGEPPHEGVETDITLQAAALGRPIEDVALLVNILGTDEAAERSPAPSRPAEPVAAPAPGAPAPMRAPAPVPGRARPDSGPGARGSRALRHVLRWPVALALLACGALHLPGNLASVSAGDPGALRALAVTVLCLGLGVLLAVRDTAAVWRTGAVAALGVAVLHVLGGVVGFDPLAGAAAGSARWAGLAAVLCAAFATVMAGLALQNRPPRDGA